MDEVVSQSETPNEQGERRNELGQFVPGVSGNPAGRPKGSSMKEFIRRKFYAMSDEEKEQWLKDNKISPETVWKMGEGNPKQDTSVEIREDEPSAIRLDE